MEQLISFMHDWQDLAGAFFGSFLAVIFSATGYFITKYIERRQRRIEILRRIEVDVSYTLTSMHTTGEKLRYFAGNARTLIAEIRAMSDPNGFALNTVNFPGLAGIYIDPEIPLFRVNSYYLHNKLLWIHSAVSDLNSTIAGLRDDFNSVLRLNEKLIDLMNATDNRRPSAQRTAYAANLEEFVLGTEKFYTQQFNVGIKTLLQVKIYNEKLRQSFFRGRFARWKHEGVSFKLFKDYSEYKKFARTLDSIDEIDKEINAEVEIALTKMTQRAEQLRSEDTLNAS